MNILNTRVVNTLVVATMIAAWPLGLRGQSSSGQDSSAAVPAATGPDTATQVIEDPPLSGLDEPSFEPGFGTRSYLLPKAQISEAVDSNSSSTLVSSTAVKDVTRGLGSLTLQKVWKVHPLDIDYTGGVSWYHGKNGKIYQSHSLGATQRLLWRTGQMALRDSFSYLPQGSFGFDSFGGASSGVAGGLGGGITGGGAGGGLFGSGQFGSISNQPRVTNMSIVDVSQAFSPRTSIVIAGGYGWTDFLNNPQGYIQSQKTVGQAGYNYKLSKRDQIALSYAFQEFHFPKAGAGNVNVNVWQVFYGHRISGKLDLSVGGGPQWIHSYSPPFLCSVFVPNTGTCAVYGPNPTPSRAFVSAAGRAVLNYRSSARTSMNFAYSYYVTPGSGFFAGANTNAIRYAVTHKLTRHLNVNTDTGYSRSSRILSVPTSTANNAKNYSFWYAGGRLRRQLGRQFGAFASYQYDAFDFGSGFCSNANPGCSRSYGRHVGLIGLDWSPSPIRLD